MSGYDLFRRRIAPIAFLAAIALIGYDACHKQERTHTTFVLDLGEARSRVRAVDATVVVDGEILSEVHRAAAPGMQIDSPRFEAVLTDDRGELQITVDLGGSDTRSFTRRFSAIEGGTTTIPLASSLATK